MHHVQGLTGPCGTPVRPCGVHELTGVQQGPITGRHLFYSGFALTPLSVV